MKNKLRVLLDVDGLILNTLQVMCDYYNKFYGYKINNIVIPDTIKTWNATESLIGYTSDDIEELFKTDFFWEEVEQYDGIYKVLEELHETELFDFSFCSIGSSFNIANKTKYLYKHFPFIKNQIMIVKNGGASAGKQMVDMSDAVMVDDNMHNLTHARYTILAKFDGDKEWNKGWNGSIVLNPDELKKELLAIAKLEGLC